MISNAYSYRYYVVDVFTDHPLAGNFLAVFPDATWLDDITTLGGTHDATRPDLQETAGTHFVSEQGTKMGAVVCCT